MNPVQMRMAIIWFITALIQIPFFPNIINVLAFVFYIGCTIGTLLLYKIIEK